DDGGEGLNARIEFKSPATATYDIVATFAGGSGAGEFTLTVREKKKLTAPKPRGDEGASGGARCSYCGGSRARSTWITSTLRSTAAWRNARPFSAEASAG